jgi:transposase
MILKVYHNHRGVIVVAKPISNEKREDIIKHMKAGERKEDIAKRLFVCVRTITRIWNKFIISGNCEPKPQGSGRKPLVSDEEMDQVVSKIKETPDITLLELIDEFGLPISASALCRRLIKLGYSFKKRRLIRRSKTVPTSKKNA